MGRKHSWRTEIQIYCPEDCGYAIELFVERNGANGITGSVAYFKRRDCKHEWGPAVGKGDVRPPLLTMDSYRAYMTVDLRKWFTEDIILLKVIPGGCISPFNLWMWV